MFQEDKKALIYVAGHRGMVGSAIVRKLKEEGYHNLLLKTSRELDLTRQKEVEDFFSQNKPQYVFVAAAKVGGILANSTYTADFIYRNLAIQNNIIHSAHLNKVQKLLFLGSSCIYPRETPQPMKEESLLTGPPEPTNEWYAIAKIAGIKMCEAYREQYQDNFISAMPTNLYGMNDNFDLNNSHVLPALMRKFHEAKKHGEKQVMVWGTGMPRREFLYVDDLAEACLFLMKNYNKRQFLNIGTGIDLTIKEAAELMKEVVGFEGELVFDSTKPDGMMLKCLDVNKINKLGWQAKHSLREGLEKTYRWYCSEID